MSRKLTTAEVQEKIRKIHGDQFELLSEYINASTRIKLRCNRCGNIIYKLPVQMTGKSKQGCYCCSKKNRHKTTDFFREEVEAKFPQMYEIIGDYKKARAPLEVRRILCGHTYLISPDNLLRGKGCPKCGIRQSHYMDIVEELLSDRNVLYVKEKRFEGCKLIRSLPFDYYLPDYNACIEVDGEFHYKENSIYKERRVGKAAFKELKERDEIKTSFCQTNGIALLRLPYFEEKRFAVLLDEFLLQANTEITA